MPTESSILAAGSRPSVKRFNSFYRPPAFPSGAIAYWSLDNNGSGGVSLVDATGNGRTLTNNNGVTLGTGRINGAASFNGSNQRLTSPVSINTTSASCSIAFWVNASNLTGERYVFFPRNVQETGLFFLNTSFSCTRTYVSNSILFSYSSIGAWNHICVVITGSTYLSYLNGVSQGSVVYVPFVLTSGEIGGSSLTGASLSGLIDEFGIWNRALTAAEISYLFNGGAGRAYNT